MKTLTEKQIKEKTIGLAISSIESILLSKGKCIIRFELKIDDAHLTALNFLQLEKKFGILSYGEKWRAKLERVAQKCSWDGETPEIEATLTAENNGANWLSTFIAVYINSLKVPELEELVA